MNLIAFDKMFITLKLLFSKNQTCGIGFTIVNVFFFTMKFYCYCFASFIFIVLLL